MSTSSKLVLAAAGLAALCTAGTPALAATCQPRPSQGEAVAPTRGEARRLALADWRQAVQRYGSGWSSWDTARSKSIGCQASQGTLQVAQWSCTAEAYACSEHQIVDQIRSTQPPNDTRPFRFPSGEGGDGGDGGGGGNR